jgi:hypothetical protein
MLPRKAYQVATVFLLCLAIIMGLIPDPKQNIELFVMFILGLGILFVPGILASAIILIPFRRYLEKQSHVLKRLLAIASTAVVLIIEFLLLTEILLRVFLPAVDAWFPFDTDTSQNDIVRSLWTQFVIPPSLRPIRPNCISSNGEVCKVVGCAAMDFPFDASYWSWIVYIFTVLLSLPASITTGILFQRFTRKAQ